jgi:DNA-binding transcriptional MerR regulator
MVQIALHRTCDNTFLIHLSQDDQDSINALNTRLTEHVEEVNGKIAELQETFESDAGDINIYINQCDDIRAEADTKSDTISDELESLYEDEEWISSFLDKHNIPHTDENIQALKGALHRLHSKTCLEYDQCCTIEEYVDIEELPNEAADFTELVETEIHVEFSTEPEHIHIISDGDSVLFYNPDIKIITVSKEFYDSWNNTDEITMGNLDQDFPHPSISITDLFNKLLTAEKELEEKSLALIMLRNKVMATIGDSE